MSTSTDENTYQLHDGYSLSFRDDSSEYLRIDVHQNEVLTHYVLLNDNQCSMITHQLCDGRQEFQDLLTDLLCTTEPDVTFVDAKYLKVPCTVHFGSQQTRRKLWTLNIELERVASVDDSQKAPDVTLDPADWNEVRSLGHRIMDDMINYLRDIRLRPAWRRIPSEIRAALAQTALPMQGQSAWEVYAEVCSHILPYPVGNIHPHYWGYVQGTGSPVGALAELITGTMNTMSWGGHQASIYIERQILSWLKVLMGFPNDESSSGVLVSGTSVATIIALAVARKKFFNRTMKIYCTKDTHSCIIRAMDLLGIGKENLVYIPINVEREMDLKALAAAIDPQSCAFIAGTAGAVATGAVDDLQGIADICAKEPNDRWFHIDGAIGAVARCSSRLRLLFNGFEHADSIAFDLHKWLFVPYECGCILIRDGQLHKSTFSQPAASYLTLMDGGITPSHGEVFFSDYGLELSRNTKALKVWMTLKTYGIEKFGQIMEQNVAQVTHFAQLLRQHPNQFQVLATGPLNIVCFRCVVSQSNEIGLDILNALNKQLLVTLQERGIAVVSPIVIDGDKFGMRMCITNHRTKMSDMDMFMAQLIELTDELLHLEEYSSLKTFILE